MTTIVKMLFGSHLYGTATENSDLDYKGVFMPDAKQVFTGKIPKSYNSTTGDNKSKNTAEDVDTEIYSLHYFIKLALEGQTVAIDMLHAPTACIIETSNIWEDIFKNRKKFYTKNLNAFVGYARRQASKYGIKGSRLDAAKEVLDLLYFLEKTDPEARISVLWNQLPTNDHCHFKGPNENGVLEYEVCGRTIQETSKAKYAIEVIRRFYDNYSLEIGVAGGDYFVRLYDFNRNVEITFRYCMSGGFEFTHPKTTSAIAALYAALKEEEE